MLVAPHPQKNHALARLVRVERDGNPLRRFGHASPFIGKLATLDHGALRSIADTTWGALPALSGNTLVIGMTESSLLLSWFLAQHAPEAVDLRFTTRKQRRIAPGSNLWRTFEEPHSHGPRHFLALEAGAHYDQVIIVEDELTTGATLRNLLLALDTVSPRFFVVTLSDMRTVEAQSQLLCDMVERGIALHTLDLSHARPAKAPRAKWNPPARAAPPFNPFLRVVADQDISHGAMERCREEFDFGALYVVGECIDVPLRYWASLPVSQRPAIQHITRSPWKIDGEAIHTRADFPGDGQGSPYFLYNFALLAPRALIVCERSNACVTGQARDFLATHGVETRCIEVAGT